ncbi:MAG TPA: hypothetical protein VJ914_16030 [Pseudonocardiaceae bacterium]|nr:hypothetical protein [Pseudonocardiaceae bacterium]
MPKVPGDAASWLLRETQQRYGGLSFRHEGPDFREKVVFGPWLEDDDCDGGEPWVEFVDHTTAIPWAILLRADGSVAFTVPGPDWTPENLIPVYPGADAVIEDAALHAECAAWRWAREQSLTLAEAELVRDRAAGLRAIPEGAGLTQWWWEGDGFRIFLTATVTRMYPARGRCTMSLWARDEHAARAAEAYLAQIPVLGQLRPDSRWPPRA